MKTSGRETAKREPTRADLREALARAHAEQVKQQETITRLEGELQEARADWAEGRTLSARAMRALHRHALHQDETVRGAIWDALNELRRLRGEGDTTRQQVNGMVRILRGLLKRADLSDDVRIEIENALDGTAAGR